MDQTYQTKDHSSRILSKRRWPKPAGLIIAAILFGLVGCSSKPGESDIEMGLVDEFKCPILEISNVKKTDGVDSGNRRYEVSYTFEVAIKGRGDAAAKLLPELDVLNERWQRGRIQNERAAHLAATSDNSEPFKVAEKRTREEVSAARNRLAEIQPCEVPNARFAIERIRAAAQPQAGSSERGVPVGLIMRGVSSMVKAESGWRFTEVPRFDITAEKVSRDNSISMPKSASLWSEYLQSEGAFAATVPSSEQCNFVEKDSKTGQQWWQCSFSTSDTNMDVWFSRLPAVSQGESFDLGAKINEIAERHNEQITDVKPVKWGTTDAAEFTATSTAGVRMVKLFLADMYEVQAIASPVPGKVANHVEMQRFIKSVKPISAVE